MKNTKSLLALFLACMMVVSCFVITPVVAADNVDVWDGNVDTSWYNDTAKEFTLTTAEQLAGLAQIVNGTASGITKDNFSGKTIKLGANIQLQSDADMANYASWSTSVAPANEWTPIGWYNTGIFQGTFDGDGHTVSGMYINDAAGSKFDGRASFIGYAKGDTVVKNLTITKSYVNAKNCAAILYAFTSGFPANTDNVDISDCTAIGNNDGTGLLMGKTGGFSTATISNCDVSGTVNCSYAGGGFVGYISGTGTMTELNILNCSGDIDMVTTYTDDRASGGVIGVVGNFGMKYASSAYNYSIVVNAINIKNTDDVERTFNISTNSKRTVGGLIGQTFLKSLGNITIEGVNVVLDIDTSSANGSSTVNISDIGGLISYIRTDAHTGTITFKDVNVSGNISVGQNSGVLIGRTNNSVAGSAVTPIQKIVVDNVTSNVKLDGMKAKGNCQCVGGVVGLSQKDINTLDVSGYKSTNTFAPYDTVATAAPGDCGGIIGSCTGTTTTVNISDCVLNDAITGRGTLGGIAGTGKYVDVNVKNVVVNSTINSASGSDISGFIGGVTTAANTYGASTFDFENCYFTGSIIGASTYAGAFIGDYDPGSGNATATSSGKPSGFINVKNCYVDADMACTTNLGGVIGRSWPKNLEINVEDSVFMGEYTGTTAPALVVSLLAGSKKETEINTTNGLISLNNVYYNVTGTTALVGAQNTSSGVNVIAADNVFYTPATVEGKQPNYKMVDFVKAMEGVEFDVEHTCKPVTMSQESAVLTDLDMTLGCEIPGCENHKVDIDFFAAPFASIRFNDYGLRFAFQIDARHNDPDSVNLGVVIIPTDLLNDAELTTATTNALNIPAENEFTSANALYKEGATTFSGVLTGIPANAETYARKMTVRAYVVIGEDTYYSEAKSISYAEVAQMIKDKNGADYQNNKTYIDSVLGING